MQCVPFILQTRGPIWSINRLRAPVAAIAMALAAVAPCWAGNNTGATAKLSWDQSGKMTDLVSVPADSFPLYLKIEAAPDVRSLAVELTWFPSHSLGRCYALVSASTVNECGVATDAAPGGGFDGDTTYAWSIAFGIPVGARDCVAFWFSESTCPGPQPANFCLVSVKLMDSLGAVDEANVLGGATLLGGTLQGCAAPGSSVFPQTLVAGQPNVLNIHGHGFETGSQVALRNQHASVSADSVEVHGSEFLTARFEATGELLGTLDVVVSTPSGNLSTIPHAVMGREVSWGQLLDGQVIAQGNLRTGEVRVPKERLREFGIGQIATAACNLTDPNDLIPFYPSVRGPVLPNCSKMKSALASNAIQYVICYGGSCPGGPPVVNLPVAISYYPKSLTGGHCHTDATRPLTRVGTPADTSGSTGSSGGSFIVDKVWPEVSGQLNVVFYSLADTFPFNSQRDTLFHYWVGVPNLVSLEPGYGYELTGGPDNVTRHPESHYGLSEVNVALQNLAVMVRDSLPGLPPMGYNDMSMVWGGIFDIQSSTAWQPPHCSHRLGRGVDFRTRGLLPGSMVSNDLARKLKRLIKLAGFAEPFKEADHWHLNYAFPTGH